MANAPQVRSWNLKRRSVASVHFYLILYGVPKARERERKQGWDKYSHENGHSSPLALVVGNREGGFGYSLDELLEGFLLVRPKYCLYGISFRESVDVVSLENELEGIW